MRGSEKGTYEERRCVDGITVGISDDDGMCDRVVPSERTGDARQSGDRRSFGEHSCCRSLKEVRREV